MTLDESQSDKTLRLRYPGTCRLCGLSFAAGALAIYERGARTIRCIECTAPSGADESVSAGVSARREYERRKQNREDRIRESHPKLGGLILALTDDPQSTRAWQSGAVGEELMAERLRTLPDSARVLHDRRIRGSRANIDHIVVSPAGVWVIDAKRYKGRRPSLRIEGGILRPRVESLRVGGRDGSKLVAGVRGQVERVVGALDGTDAPVTGVLCFLDGDWPLIGGSFTVNGVEVVWPRLLVKKIRSAEGSGVDVDSVHARLAAAFPSAS